MKGETWIPGASTLADSMKISGLQSCYIPSATDVIFFWLSLLSTLYLDPEII